MKNKLFLLLVMLSSLANSGCAEVLKNYECHRRTENRPDAGQRQAECAHPGARQQNSEGRV